MPTSKNIILFYLPKDPFLIENEIKQPRSFCYRNIVNSFFVSYVSSKHKSYIFVIVLSNDHHLFQSAPKALLGSLFSGNKLNIKPQKFNSSYKSEVVITT